MCISGTEPSSVILSQTSSLLKCDAKKGPNQAEAKRDGVKTHKITISVLFKHRKCLMLRVLKRHKSTKVKGLP